MLDRNKTVETIDVTAAALDWLRDHGFKPLATEVRVADGWHADIAAVIDPTNTELIKLKLVPCPPRWEDRERRLAWEETARVANRLLTCLIEIKTTRSDFLSDPKWTRPLPVDLAYLCVPANLLKTSEWPEGWGVVEVHADRVRQVQRPKPRQATPEEQRDIILSIAMRNHNVETYAHLRQVNQEQRLEHAQRRLRSRVENVATAIRQICEATRPFELCLMMNNIHERELPDGYIEQFLRPLYGISKPSDSGAA